MHLNVVTHHSNETMTSYFHEELIMLQKMVLNSIPQVKLDLKLFTMMSRKKNSEFLSSASVYRIEQEQIPV